MLDTKVVERNGVKAIELKVERCSKWTNTGRGFWVISLRQKKFLKPAYRAKDTAVWYLLPGNYIFVWWFYWNKEEPPHTVTVKLVRLDIEGEGVKMDTVKSVEYMVNSEGAPLPDTHPAKPLITEILKRRPAYHGGPDWREGPAPLPERVEELFIGYVEVSE